VAQYEVRDDAPDDSQEYGQQEPQAASGSFRVHVYRLFSCGKYRDCQEFLPSCVNICDGSAAPVSPAAVQNPCLRQGGF